MSISLLNAAYGVKLKPSEKAVLNNLAGRTNPDSGLCNPSVGRIARDTGFARSAIFTALNGLETKGLISRKAVGGRPNHYRVHRGAIERLTKKEIGPVQPLDGPRPADGPLGSTEWTQTKENQIESIVPERSSQPLHVESNEANRESNGVAVAAAKLTTAELIQTVRGYLKIGQSQLAYEYLSQLAKRAESQAYDGSAKVVSFQTAKRS